jgi:hypothetical protein
LHAEVPHLPLAQSFLQQSAFALHALPSGLHVGAGLAHCPPVQAPLQQSLAFWQLAPLLLHEPDSQEPETQSLLQQSGLDEQLAPTLLHDGCAHLPPVQVPLQQSVPLWHDLPDA